MATWCAGRGRNTGGWPRSSGRNDGGTACSPGTGPCSRTGNGRALSSGSDEKSGVNREVHAPFRGSPGVKFPRATRLNVYKREHVSDEPSLTMSERVRLREAESELRELRQKVTFLEKVAAYFASEPR